MQKKLSNVRTALLMLMLIVSVLMIVYYVTGSMGNKDLNDRLLAIHDAAPSQPSHNEVVPDDPMLTARAVLPEIEGLLSINQDCAGWIEINGTKINNVVVQNEDNDYYLSHNFNGDFAEAGTIFIDYRCAVEPEIQCSNIILYGHNQRDGSMFAPLLQFKNDPLSVRNAPTITLSTKYDKLNFNIVAFFVVDVNEGSEDSLFQYYNYINYTEDEFNEFKNEVKKRSLIETDTDFSKDDLLVTLSTCCSDFGDSRFVVIGKCADPHNPPTYKRAG